MITDLTPYRQHVDQFDLSEQEKLELVNAVWMLVENLYDHQLGINQLLLLNKNNKSSVDCDVPPVIVEEVNPSES
jgi:hypothetical protein